MYWLPVDKYETGTNVTRTTKKTPLTTFMKGEEWRLFLSFLLKSDKFTNLIVTSLIDWVLFNSSI
jgi:hypothetical protein